MDDDEPDRRTLVEAKREIYRTGLEKHGPLDARVKKLTLNGRIET